MPRRRILARADLASLEPTFRAIRERHGVREEHPREAVEEALGAASASGELPHVEGDRADRTDVALVTIDPPGARDLDQALAIEDLGEAGWRIHYAIADVAAHVIPGGALDRDTWSRGETVYCPDVRVGLHPAEMSEGFASLLPGQVTKAALWTIAVATDGRLGEASVGRAWVRSRAQYSYPQLQDDPPKEAKPLVDAMRRFGDARRAQLRSRGGVTLPKPSQEIVEAGGALALEFRAAVGVEDDNAQVSLVTGEAAARIMLEARAGVLRTMPAAEQRDLDRLRRQALAIGVAWPQGATYNDVLRTLDPATPRAAAFLAQATRLFRGAEWQPFDEPTLPAPHDPTHGALAAPYAHVTAPLRRLVDRYGTEVCLAHCASREVPAWVRAALPRLGAAMTAGVRTASAVDRECIDAVESAVLAPHVGELFAAVGLDERTVQLSEPAVVARCTGQIAVGERQSVRLVSAEFDKGPVFEVA